MKTILETIGNTPLVALRHLTPPGSARVLVKLEGMNPTGSMKDRMALAMIAGAEASGRLKPGMPVIEYTGGSTGTSLAFVCAAKGYRLYLVSSDAFSDEKLKNMRALGAELHIVPSVDGRVTPDLFVRMQELTETLIAETGAFWTDQFNNHDQVKAYGALADEIWQQSDGAVTAFVHSVGTSGSLRGTSTRLRHYRPDVHVVAVEPAESAVLSGGTPGAHKIEGMGTGRKVPLWSDDLADAIEAVSTEDAMAMARRLARDEAIFTGTSAGANVVAALRVAARLGPDATVVTLACDHGLKYLSTEIYNA